MTFFMTALTLLFRRNSFSAVPLGRCRGDSTIPPAQEDHVRQPLEYLIDTLGRPRLFDGLDMSEAVKVISRKNVKGYGAPAAYSVLLAHSLALAQS